MIKRQQSSEYNLKEADTQVKRTSQWLPARTGEGDVRQGIKMNKLLGMK